MSGVLGALDTAAEAVLHAHYSRLTGERAKTIARAAKAATERRVAIQVHDALSGLARVLSEEPGPFAAQRLQFAEEAVLEAWEAQLS
jgi:hypothetical protein